MSGSVASLQEGRWKYTRNGLVRWCEAPVPSRTQPDDGKEGWAVCWHFYVDSRLGSQTAPSSSARRNQDGIAEEEWTGQVQENSERLSNPLDAVFTVTEESMYLRHGSAQALLPGSSSCSCETIKVQSSKLSKETRKGLRSRVNAIFRSD